MSWRHGWHTPPAWFEAARLIMGSIDLDPCTDDVAARNMQPARWFTPDLDGLSQPWDGNVFLNPPGGKVWKSWAKKAWQGLADGSVKQLFYLGFNLDQFRAFEGKTWSFRGKETLVAIPRKRIAFIHPLTAEKSRSPEHGNFVLMILSPEAVPRAELHLSPVCNLWRPF